MFNLYTSLPLGPGIPASSADVEAYSPLTPITNHLFGIDSYGMGAFGLGASNLFGGGLYGSPAPIGAYGRFADTMPSFIPQPFFIPSAQRLVPAGNVVPDNNVNLANFLNFSSSTNGSSTISPRKSTSTAATPTAKAISKPEKKQETSAPRTEPRTEPRTAPAHRATPPAAPTERAAPRPPEATPPRPAPVPTPAPTPQPAPTPPQPPPAPQPRPAQSRPPPDRPENVPMLPAIPVAPAAPPVVPSHASSASVTSPATVPERLKYGRAEFVRSDSFYVNMDKQHYFIDVSDIADSELARQYGENEIAKLTAEGMLEENWNYFEYKENGRMVKRFFECGDGDKQKAEKTKSDNGFVFDLIRKVGAENVDLVAFYHQHPLSEKDTEANNVLFPPSPLDLQTAINISKRFVQSGFENIPVEHVVVETAGVYRLSPQEAVLKSKNKAEDQIQPYLGSVQTLTRPNPATIVEALEEVNFNASFRFFNPNLETLVKKYDEMRNYKYSNTLTPNRKINFRREIDQLLEKFSDEEKKKYRGILNNISSNSNKILNPESVASNNH